MTMDYSRYPADWKAISLRVRAAAHGRCEWCGVPHGQRGARDRFGVWHEESDIHHLNSDAGLHLFGDFPHISRIILTVAHLGAPPPDSPYPWGDKHDKHDVRDCNLAALCQACHLGYDRDDHIAHQRENRARRKGEAIAATGQLAIGGVA